MYTLSGTLKVKKETQQVTDSFKKREFVVTDMSGNYPQDVLFQLTQDRTSLLDNVNENEVVNVTFNIRGREWTSPQGEVKYFNSLDAWRIDKGQGGAATPPPADSSNATINAANAETLVDDDDDDLPF